MKSPPDLSVYGDGLNQCWFLAGTLLCFTNISASLLLFKLLKNGMKIEWYLQMGL